MVFAIKKPFTTQVIDVPMVHRGTYRTTLGHLANHRFTGTNAFASMAHHPVAGGTIALVAERVIHPGQVGLRKEPWNRVKTDLLILFDFQIFFIKLNYVPPAG